MEKYTLEEVVNTPAAVVETCHHFVIDEETDDARESE